MHRFSRKLAPLTFLVVGLLFLAAPANAGPAGDVVAKLNAAFIDVMQNAKALGYGGRYAKLEPVADAVYDFAEMTRVTTGRYWRDFDDEQKQRAVTAFRDLSIATFAARFDGFSGERFDILGEAPAAGGNLRVNNQIVPGSGEPIHIDYLLRQTDAGWRIIDVYLKGSVSELAVRRSEFTNTLAKSGFDGFIADLKAKVAKLREGAGG